MPKSWVLTELHRLTGNRRMSLHIVSIVIWVQQLTFKRHLYGCTNYCGEPCISQNKSALGVVPEGCSESNPRKVLWEWSLKTAPEVVSENCFGSDLWKLLWEWSQRLVLGSLPDTCLISPRIAFYGLWDQSQSLIFLRWDRSHTLIRTSYFRNFGLSQIFKFLLGQKFVKISCQNF